MESIKTFIAHQNKYSIQYRSLHLMLIVGMFIGYIGSLIRLVAQAGISHILLSLMTGIICTLLLYYAHRGDTPYLAKVTFILFMDFIFFPLSWISSPGSLSFMPYYSILFLLMTFMLMERQYEYLFPGLFMMTSVFLMYAEVRWPILVHPYEATSQSALHVGFHYAFVTAIITIIFLLVFRNFLDTHGNLTRQYVSDELTGLFSRSHGLRLLRQTFEASRRDYKDYTLLLISLTGIEAINDGLGSEEGDRLICFFSDLLKSNTRDDDICTRYSGNLFMVMLSKTNTKQVHGFIHRLERPFQKEAEKYDNFSPKFLVGMAGFDYNDIGEVMSAAEADLDGAKNDFYGGNNA